MKAMPRRLIGYARLRWLLASWIARSA